MNNILIASVIASAALLGAVSCNDADTCHGEGGSVGVNTSGKPIINTGGGVGIDPSSGKVNIDVGGGIMIPLG